MVNYTYLDDESKDSVEPYIDAIEEEAKALKIHHLYPVAHSKQLQVCRQREQDGFLDGLILDLRLDQKPNNGERADYRAATLAQEIRTRATEGNLGEYPIVLWSTDEKLDKSYVKDDTSHDLFDLKATKADILDDIKAKRFAKQLVALVDGYKAIKKIKSVARTHTYRFLGFEIEPTFIDLGILSQIDNRNGVLPSHEYARFIISDLLEKPGPLIGENILAARLGIDIYNSPDFDKLLQKRFSNAAYKGPFADGWPAWWSASVEETWRNFSGSPKSLRTLPAADRVSFLKKVSGLKGLVAFTPEFPIQHTTFWTICQATLKPLDPKDGFLIDRQPSYSWQDRLYVSLNALRDGIAENKKIRIDPLEKNRFQKAKDRLKDRE